MTSEPLQQALEEIYADADRVVAALWDRFPFGCTEDELRVVVLDALCSTEVTA